MTSPIGRLIRKIHRQLEVSISQPPRIGPAIGASSIGMLMIDIRRPSRPGPASRVMIMKPRGNSIPPPMPCTTRNTMSCKMVDAKRTQQRAQRERHHRAHEEPFGAEPVGCPAGQRDDGRQGERVAGHRPRDDGLGGPEFGDEGALRDADDGDVQDRHHRGQDAHAGDPQQLGVQFVGIDRCRRSCRAGAVGGGVSAAAERAFSMALLSISNRSTAADAGMGFAGRRVAFRPSPACDVRPQLTSRLCGRDSAPRRLQSVAQGRIYACVCVSFTIPTPEIGKLRVCLEN